MILKLTQEEKAMFLFSTWVGKEEQQWWLLFDFVHLLDNFFSDSSASLITQESRSGRPITQGPWGVKEKRLTSKYPLEW